MLRLEDPSAATRALELIRQGEVVAVPTDTVYGIATDGFDETAVERLFVVKERPSHKAIMLLLGDLADLHVAVTRVTEELLSLAEAFWPGGLTLVVSARPELPPNLTAGSGTIGIRLPDAPFARALARALGHPLAATSANLSGGPNPRTAADVLYALGGRIPLIVDGGATPGALPSTVLDCTVEPPRVLRVGALAVTEIARVLGVPAEQLARLPYGGVDE